MKNFILKTMVLLLTLMPTLAFASGPGFGGGVNDGGNCGVPLDGGLSLLAASGIGYGVKVYMNQKKKRENSYN